MKTIKVYRTETPYAFEYSIFDEKKHPKNAGEERLFIFKKYNDPGNLVEYKKFFPDGKPSFEQFAAYDSEGRKSSERKIFHETGSEELAEYAYSGDTVRTELSNNGAVYKIIETKKNGDAIIEETHLDPDSIIIESSRWDLESNLVYRFDGEETHYEYDDKGNILKTRRLQGESIFEELYEYEGEHPKRISYLEDGEDIGFVEFDYEQEGETLVTREHEGDDTISEMKETKNAEGKVTRYERKEYDEEGNATSFTQSFEYDDAGRVKRVTVITDPKKQAYVRHAPAVLSRSKEIKYDESGRQTEILLASYQEEDLEPESYYRIEYDQSSD